MLSHCAASRARPSLSLGPKINIQSGVKWLLYVHMRRYIHPQTRNQNWLPRPADATQTVGKDATAVTTAGPVSQSVSHGGFVHTARYASCWRAGRLVRIAPEENSGRGWVLRYHSNTRRALWEMKLKPGDSLGRKG